MQKFNIELNNSVDCGFTKSDLKKIALETFALSDVKDLENREIEISVAFVKEDEIKRVNGEYRKKDSVTDVLSFAEFEEKKDLQNYKGEKVYLGEIVMCPAYIREYAAEESLEFEKEFVRAFSHSVLHLLGYQHGKRMFMIQNEIADNFGFAASA